MKRFCVALLFVLLSTVASAKPLANQSKSGLYVRSIEQVLRLPPDEVDLATAVLIISEEWSDIVYGRRFLTELDDMVFEIDARLKAKSIPTNHRAIPVINKYLFQSQGFKTVKDADDPNDLFLHIVLERKRGYCLSLSILYLAIGERLGLPLYGVVVPGHFFVRYDDGHKRFNIETTSKGTTASDEHYIKKFKVPPETYRSIYMKNLDNIQTLGCFFNNLGNSYDNIGDIETARRSLEQSVKINPSLAESRTNLGNIYLRKEMLDEAISQYLSAQNINPNDAKMYNNLGNAYAQKDWMYKAISQYRQSLELDPKFSDAYLSLASAYSKTERYDLAITMLKKGQALAPENADFYYQFGNVYTQTEYFEKAIKAFKKALKINPDHAHSYYGLAVCYGKMDMLEKEIEAFKKALAIDSKMTSARISLGNAYFRNEKYDDAIEHYKKAVRDCPDDASIYQNLGAAYSNKELNEQSVNWYIRAVNIDPEMAIAHNGLASAYYRLEEYEKSWEHLKIAEGLGAEVNEDLIANLKMILKIK